MGVGASKRPARLLSDTTFSTDEEKHFPILILTIAYDPSPNNIVFNSWESAQRQRALSEDRHARQCLKLERCSDALAMVASERPAY